MKKKKNILPILFFTEEKSYPDFFHLPHTCHLPDNYLENMHPRQFYDGFGFKECLDERIRI